MSISPVFSSTADAAALRSMAAQRLFGDALIDGPLTADSALSPDAARANGARPGRAQDNPDIVLARTWAATLMLHADRRHRRLAAGLVLGAGCRSSPHAPTAWTCGWPRVRAGLAGRRRQAPRTPPAQAPGSSNLAADRGLPARLPA
ncbi:MAG: hypothetical protein IPJ62_16945 [Betaproteobacteria bacterium]|nr:hypothetical protein [Betaproteobacteria bacterium]